MPKLGLIIACLSMLSLANASSAADTPKPRADGCIGVNCGPDTGPPKQQKPRQDGCIGSNCGKDSAPTKPTPRNDGCIGVNCGPDKKTR